MRFLKDQLFYVVVFWHYEVILKEYRSLTIYRETFSTFASKVLFDLLDTTTMFLGSYDLILKSWFHYQGGKESLRNYLQIKLLKFLMEKWLTLQQHKVIAIRFTT